jgi:transposase-like protein
VKKLSREQKEEIRKQYADGQRLKVELSIKGIARRFKICPRTVQRIVREVVA